MNGAEVNKTELHPVAMFFYIVFKLAALVVYFFSGWFYIDFTIPVITIILLLCIDFYAVKNILGPILISCKWGYYVDDNGITHWYFQSKKNTEEIIDYAENLIFWSILIINPVIWLVMFYATIFQLNANWFVVVCIALTLNIINLIGFIHCKYPADSTGTVKVFKDFFPKDCLKRMYTAVKKKKEKVEERNEKLEQP
ncbi:uncharacterized Golgi apparatus membrane protein-like protein CG5021 isoform X1 [Centruroides sculpturatus]|uniref:uncharacterized Golgi apparatus membrane protein-like protein CG5021 isoform X1 n=2 Tax=Centruroides sculpturatus TaxID=218467 RepID=UPI000C6E5463|nr:uncharacterized Golgi apparatus membrane protein-like protein CG5021 isoform X1 [Centruroides sculpturatus]XP_023227512.1 uncharacterized Golgi apparatus membrane protein-like protein CG5021 isoform X1 [Centruroides sculpturatus]